MPIALRDYQEDAISETMKARAEGLTRLLTVLPTGCGKTIVFSKLAEMMRAKTLILAHRDELIRQAEDKVRMVWPDAVIGIVKGRENDFHNKNVVCASVQTLSREKRLTQLIDQNFGLLVIDECHHSMARTYRDIIDDLGFSENDPEKLLFGCTATPSRMDRRGLGAVYQKIVYSASILTMIRAGYLADLRGYRAQTDTDLSGVGVRGGDYIESQLAKCVNTPKRNDLVVQSYLEHAPQRKGIAFCANVQHAEDLANMFLCYDIEAKAIDGLTPLEERSEALQAFRRGEIQILTNCSLFTEGFDEPSIESVLMCRPTKSAGLYAQCVGRGTRRYPGKYDCIVIDFADNRHDICQLPQLMGWDDRRMEDGKSVTEIITLIQAEEQKSEDQKKKAGEQLTLDLPSIRIEEFDLLNKSRFNWLFDGHQWRLPIKPGIENVLIPDGNGKFQVFLIQKDHDPELLHPSSLDLGYAQGVSEDYLRRNGSQSFANKNARWRKDQATEAQIERLKKIGKYRDGITKGEANEIITAYYAKMGAKRINRQLTGIGIF